MIIVMDTKDQLPQELEEPPPIEPPGEDAGLLYIFCDWIGFFAFSRARSDCYGFKKTDPGISIYIPNLSFWRHHHY